MTIDDRASGKAFALYRDRVDDWGKVRDCQVHNIEQWLADLGMRNEPQPRPDYCDPYVPSRGAE